MTDAPEIGSAPIAGGPNGLQMQPLCYSDPFEYPLGIELVLMKPGQVAPIAKAMLPKGFLLVAIPPGGGAEQLMGMMRAEIARQQAAAKAAGKVAAPGMRD